MAICLTFGTHDYRDQLRGYENVVAQCHNCGNWAARCETEFPMFTICFVPLIPLATHKYKLVACPICHYKQDLSSRPDVESQMHGGPPPQGGQQFGPPQGNQHGYPQGYQQQQQHMGHYGPQK